MHSPFAATHGLLVAFFLAQVANGELLTNGDFETGDLTGWTFSPDANSEPLMVGEVAMFEGSNAFRVNPGHDQRFTGDLGGVLSQTVSLVAGTTYRVSAGLIAIQDVNSNPGDTLGNAEGGTIAVSLGGTLLHTLDIGDIDVDEVILDSFAAQYLASTTGDVDFEIHFSRGYANTVPSVYHFADDLSIAQVPEPDNLLVIGYGLAALLPFAGRRPRDRQVWTIKTMPPTAPKK